MQLLGVNRSLDAFQNKSSKTIGCVVGSIDGLRLLQCDVDLEAVGTTSHEAQEQSSSKKDSKFDKISNQPKQISSDSQYNGTCHFL